METNKGRGKGYGKPWGQQRYFSACFNCGRADHARYDCPEPQTVCDHCGANHVSEMCSLGPGGPLRESLSANARMAIDRAAGKGRQTHHALLTMPGESTSESHAQATIDTSTQSARPYNANGKRPHQTLTYREVRPYDNNASNAAADASSGTLTTATGHHPSSGDRAYTVGSQPRAPTTREIGEFLRSSGYGVFVAREVSDNICMQAADPLHSLVYIDSQASHFVVVPDVACLTKVTNRFPTVTVKTTSKLQMAALDQMQLAR